VFDRKNEKENIYNDETSSSSSSQGSEEENLCLMTRYESSKAITKK